MKMFRILKFVMDEEEYIERSGDLEETARFRRKCGGSLWLLFQVLGTFCVALMNRTYWRCVMFKSYIRTAFRHLSRNRRHALINIAGLAIGMAVFILVALFYSYESGWDKFNENYHQIYRVGTRNYNPTSMCAGVGQEIAQAVPQVLQSCRFRVWSDYFFDYGADAIGNRNTIKVPKLVWVDSTLFDIFTLSMVYGDAKTALSDPHSLVITHDLSRKMFGNENPVGRVIRVNNHMEFTISGVVQKPDRFHMPFDALGPYYFLGHEMCTKLTSWNTPTYVLLSDIHDLSAVESSITTHFHDKLFQANGVEIEFSLFPLADIYLNDIRPGQSWKTGDRQFMNISLAVAVAVLLLASVNFINLTSAKGMTRAREVGIRKVSGSSRSRLMGQFLVESVMYSVGALGVALVLMLLLLGRFNELMRVNIPVSTILSPGMLILMLAGTVVVGLAAGLYPAFTLSAFHPVAILKGEKNRGRRAVLFRRGMLVMQFFISVVLIIGTLTVYGQVHYMKNKDLGFQKEHILQFRLTGELRSQKEAFKARLLTDPKIEAVSFSNAYPERINNYESIQYNGERKGFAIFTVDPDYADVYELKMKKGRFLDPARDIQKPGRFVINETAVKVLGLEEPVVGTLIKNDVYESTAFPVAEIEIIGVVKDFHYKSLHNDIWPLAFNWNSDWEFLGNVRVSPFDVRGSIAHIRSVWDQMSPGAPFEFQFMDDYLDQKYRNDERMGRLMTTLAFLGLFIAAMGLLGLSMFLTRQRTKEIGIRKVLGASLGRIFTLLTREFVLLILISSAAAFPVAWLLMTRWLQGYPYRTCIHPLFFAVAAGITLFAALATIGWQVWRAAREEAVKSLRYE